MKKLGMILTVACFSFATATIVNAAEEKVPALKPGQKLMPVAITTSASSLPSRTGDLKFEWKDRSFRVYQIKAKPTGDESMDEMYGYGPVIEIVKGDKKFVVDLSEQFKNNVITSVYQDEYNKRIWVAIEWGIAGPGEQYDFIISDDGGDTWRLGAPLKRPSKHPRATLSHLWLSGAGTGEVWFTQDASFVTSEKTLDKDMKRGQELIFKATTSNAGRSWKVNPKPMFYNGLMEVRPSAN